MKKFTSSRLIVSLLICGVLAVFISCLPDIENIFLAEDAAKNEIIASYQQIGADHNNKLTEYYNEVTKYSVSILEETEIFDDFFGIGEEVFRIELSIPSFGTRSVDNSDSLVYAALENDLISTDGAVYMARVEDILYTPFYDIDGIHTAITSVQYQALDILTGSALDEFMAYSETAKSSLVFWSDNYEKMTEPDYDYSSSPINGASRVAFWDQVLYAALSDAAGAAAGALVGATMCSSIPGVGSSVGATIGAVIAGAASSAKGFSTGHLCIIVPIAKIEFEANKKNN